MIFTERTIMVVNDSATINKPLILYRGDKNIELKITIAESQFKFRNNDASNVIETTDASYAQLVINTPYNSPIFSEVAATKNGTVIFVISEAMIDEIREVGIYDIQIRLLDDDKQSRVTIPPVSNAIEIREPMAIEDGSVVDSNAVNVAKVNRALTTTSAPLEAFDSQGNYIKNNWGDGVLITDAALNKMEAGIEGVNNKVVTKTSQLKTDIEDIQGKINIIGDASQLLPNLFDANSSDSKDNTWLDTNGKEITQNGQCITNYIPCSIGMVISRYVNNSLLPFNDTSIFLFNSNKTFIKRVNVKNSDSYTIVDKASYLRTWYDIDNKDNFAIYDTSQIGTNCNIINLLQNTPTTISVSDNILTLKNYKNDVLSQITINSVINGVPINTPVDTTNLFDANSSDSKDNTWLDANGKEIPLGEEGGITNYIPCYKGCAIARYVNGVLSKFTDATIFLFDSNKTFLQLIKPYNGEAYYVTNDNVCYLRTWYDIDKKADTFICDLKHVDLYGKTDNKDYKTIQNTDGAINMMLQTGREYAIDGNFGYGTDYTCLDDTTGLKESEFEPKKYEGTRYQIDCSSFVKVCMMGLTPQNSRYYTEKNTPSKYGYQWDDTIAEYVTTTEVTHTPQTGKYGRLYANKIAKYAWKKGYLYNISNDFSKVKVGDLLFWCAQNPSYNYWKNISHVAIVVETGYDASDIKIMEVVGNNTIAIRGLYNNNVIKYGARYPMPYQNYIPRELYSSNEESLNFTDCKTNTGVEIKQMQLNCSIIRGYTYTLIFKFTSNVNEYNISINCAGYTQNISKNNNNAYVVHIFIPYNQSISNDIKNKLSINITPTTDIASLNINMEWCKVYKGYVSFSNESLI